MPLRAPTSRSTRLSLLIGLLPLLGCTGAEIALPAGERTVTNEVTITTPFWGYHRVTTYAGETEGDTTVTPTFVPGDPKRPNLSPPE